MTTTTLTIVGSKKKKLMPIGCLRGGHTDWVTGVEVLQACPDRIISTSRDKSILIWKIHHSPDLGLTGIPFKRLLGHSHFISDIATTPDSLHCLTGSWDRTLRLWDLNTGKTSKRFVGHTKDVLSVGLSTDNRQIVSGSRDKTVKIWNTLADCKYTMTAHTDWVSAVNITPPTHVAPKVISTSWDKTVKVWSTTTLDVEHTFDTQKDSVVCMAVSPDATLCATGSKDKSFTMWNLTLMSKIWDAENLVSDVRALHFFPHQYRLCAAAGDHLYVYDISLEKAIDVQTISGTTDTKFKPEAISLAWSVDNNTLFTGCTDGHIRCWKFEAPAYQMGYDDEDD